MPCFWQKPNRRNCSCISSNGPYLNLKLHELLTELSSLYQELFLFCSTHVTWSAQTFPNLFYKSRNHLYILGASMVTWNVFHTADPQFWTGLWTSLLSGTFCLAQVKWFTFLYVRKKTAIIMVKILGDILQNSVALDLCIPDTWN